MIDYHYPCICLCRSNFILMFLLLQPTKDTGNIYHGPQYHTVCRHLEKTSQRILSLELGVVTRTTKQGKLITRILELCWTAKGSTAGDLHCQDGVPRTPRSDLFELSIVPCLQWYLFHVYILTKWKSENLPVYWKLILVNPLYLFFYKHQSYNL